MKPKLVKQTYCDIDFLIPDYYIVKQILEEGAYGIIARAWSKKININVAIKKISCVFNRDLEDGFPIEFQKRIFRELLILDHFQGHENIIKVLDIILPPNYEKFNDVYIVMELMDCDFTGIMKNNKKLKTEEVKYFMYNILRGLKWFHSAGVIHRDLKPANMLCNTELEVKLIDFGLSRGIDINTKMSTRYVVTRYYRAPELLCIWNKSTTAIDMWSIGCIFAELLSHKEKYHEKILLPGRNHLDQLHKIIDFFGTPLENEIRGSPKAKRYILSLPKKKGKNLKKVFPNATSEGIDLLKKMLEFDPVKRITVEEALEHSFFKELHDINDEPSQKKFDFRFTKELTNSKTIKELMYKFIVEWNERNNGFSSLNFEKDYKMIRVSSSSECDFDLRHACSTDSIEIMESSN